MLLLLSSLAPSLLLCESGRAHRTAAHARSRASAPLLSSPAVEPRVILVDDEGDPMVFLTTPDGVMQMFERDELLCRDIRSISFAMEQGIVSLDSEEVDAEFSIDWEEQKINLARLALLAAESDVEWEGDEPLTLPKQVEALLVGDELSAGKPAVRLLWLE
ncbi:MAG: hypothetical protein SGPRY_010470 [Prymnesium sp.]